MDREPVDDRNAIYGETEATNSPPVRAWKPIPLLRNMAFALLMLLVCVGFGIYAFYQGNEQTNSKKEIEVLKQQMVDLKYQRAYPVDSPRPGESTDAQSTEFIPKTNREAELRAMENIALSKAALSGFEERLDKLEANYGDFIKTKKQVQAKLALYLTDTIGNKIASEPALIEQFVVLQEKSNSADSNINEIPVFATESRAVVDEARLNPEIGYRLRDSTLQRLQSLSTELGSALLIENDILVGLNSIGSTAVDLPIGNDLAGAIEEMKDAQWKAMAEKMELARSQEREKVLNEAQQRVKDAERDLVNSKIDMDLAESEAAKSLNQEKARQIRVATEDALAETRANAADKQLRAEYARVKPELKRYLTPFISEGRMLRGALGGKGPVSFKEILGRGALNKTDDGVLALFDMGGARDGTSYPKKNDRPGGGFPQYIGNGLSYYPEGTREFLEKAQGFLIKFGVLMAEDGLLEN